MLPRPYKSADHPAVVRFLAGVFAQMGRRFVPEGKDADVRDLEAVYLGEGGAFRVLEIGEEICGTAGVRRFSGEIAELKRLYLAPERRGRGHGEALARAAIADARTLGYRFLRLDTAPGDTPAAGLFRKLGFREIPKYTADPYQELYFELEL